MRTFARFLQVLSFVVWIGGIIFFSFVEAPNLFKLLPTVALAGNVVGHSLAMLHYIGLVCGAVFLGASFLRPSPVQKPMRMLILLMMFLTAVSQFGVTRQIHHLRETVGAVEVLPAKDAGRMAFDRLHQISVILESIVLIAGVATIWILAGEERLPAVLSSTRADHR
jgi:hypothetical protein